MERSAQSFLPVMGSTGMDRRNRILCPRMSTPFTRVCRSGGYPKAIDRGLKRARSAASLYLSIACRISHSVAVRPSDPLTVGVNVIRPGSVCVLFRQRLAVEIHVLRPISCRIFPYPLPRRVVTIRRCSAVVIRDLALGVVGVGLADPEFRLRQIARFIVNEPAEIDPVVRRDFPGLLSWVMIM